MNSSNHSSVFSGYAEHASSIGTACYAVNLILSFPTNVYVLWLIVTGARETMASEFFSLNLAVSEILSSLCSVFFFVYIYLPIPSLLVPVTFCGGFLIFGRTLFQSCICFERYLAVVHPVVFLKYKLLRYKVACSGLVWLVVIGFCLTFMLANSLNVIYFASLGEILVFISFMLFCCLSVLRALKCPGPREGDREREGTNNMKMRAFKIILIIMVAMMVNYLPWVKICHFIGILHLRQFLSAIYVCVFIGVVCGFVQPLLYLHRAGKLPCIRGL